jgi:enoyl-CoA hydratase/carnithine racemase
MWREVGDAFHLLGSIGDECRCILLLGNGKSFCAGIDIADPNFGLMEMGEDDENDDTPDTARKFISFRSKVLEMQSCLSALEECAVPVVAAIHGSCIGGGIDLITCADIRICSPTAKFSIREARLGLAADVGTLQRLPKIVGHTSRVRELCYTGEDFDGIEAERIGLVSKLSKSQDDLIAVGLEICKNIVRNGPVAVQGTKVSLNFSRDHSVREGLEHVAMYNSAALMTSDLSASFIASTSGTTPEFSNMLPHARL